MEGHDPHASAPTIRVGGGCNSMMFESGSDYGYLFDGDAKAYPDPRSRWQPNGVHNLSRVYDDNAFCWNDASFQSRPLSSAVIYELHIGTFTERGHPRLGHWQARPSGRSGHVTHVELMPLAAFAGDRDGVTTG
jgi:maltooligosyltrehalose trehalohydrolase